MEQLIEYFTVDKFTMLEMLFWCIVTFSVTLWGCLSAIKDNAKKEKKAKEVLLDEMHRMYLKEPQFMNTHKCEMVEHNDFLGHTIYQYK